MAICATCNKILNVFYWCEVTGNLTFDPQNLISSSLSPNSTEMSSRFSWDTTFTRMGCMYAYVMTGGQPENTISLSTAASSTKAEKPEKFLWWTIQQCPWLICCISSNGGADLKTGIRADLGIISQYRQINYQSDQLPILVYAHSGTRSSERSRAGSRSCFTWTEHSIYQTKPASLWESMCSNLPLLTPRPGSVAVLIWGTSCWF